MGRLFLFGEEELVEVEAPWGAVLFQVSSQSLAVACWRTLSCHKLVVVV